MVLLLLALPVAAICQDATADVCSERLNDVGWSIVHKVAEAGDLPRMEALILGGHDVDERVEAGDELAVLYARHARRYGNALVDTFAEDKELADSAFDQWEEEVRNLGSVTSMFLCEGATSLHIASAKDHVPLVEFLLGRGADPCAATRYALLTPLDMAAMGNAYRVVPLLVKAGSCLNPSREPGGAFFAPIHWTAIFNARDAAAKLLQLGADPNEPSKDIGPYTGAEVLPHTILLRAASAFARTASTRHGGITPMDFLTGWDDAYLLRKTLDAHGGKCAMNCDADPNFEGLAKIPSDESDVRD